MSTAAHISAAGSRAPHRKLGRVRATYATYFSWLSLLPRRL